MPTKPKGNRSAAPQATTTQAETTQASAGNAARDEDIRRRAYEIYLESGEQPGRALDDWLQAERELETGVLSHAQLTKRSNAFLIFAAAMLLIAGTVLRGAAQTTPSDQSRSTSSDDSTQIKIARAMSAGPVDVAKAARIVDTDAQGRMIVLREGNNGFTCMPGNLKAVGEPPMCVDAAAMQWYDDAKAHKPKPTNTVPGITYMLAGATQRSDSDPHDTTSMPIEIGPHWMIMWPFDPKTTGLPTAHKPTGAYIMWAGSPYAHVHIMGRP